MIPSSLHTLLRTNCRRQINGGSLLKVPVPRFLPSFSGRRPHFQSPLLLGARTEVEVICAEIRLFHVPFPCSFHSFRLIAASTPLFVLLLYLALFPFPLHPSLGPSITAFVNTIIAGSASEAATARPRPHSFVAHVHNASRTAEL